MKIIPGILCAGGDGVAIDIARLLGMTELAISIQMEATATRHELIHYIIGGPPSARTIEEAAIDLQTHSWTLSTEATFDLENNAEASLTVGEISGAILETLEDEEPTGSMDSVRLDKLRFQLCAGLVYLRLNKAMPWSGDYSFTAKKAAYPGAPLPEFVAVIPGFDDMGQEYQREENWDVSHSAAIETTVQPGGIYTTPGGILSLYVPGAQNAPLAGSTLGDGIAGFVGRYLTMNLMGREFVGPSFPLPPLWAWDRGKSITVPINGNRTDTLRIPSPFQLPLSLSVSGTMTLTFS